MIRPFRTEWRARFHPARLLPGSITAKNLSMFLAIFLVALAPLAYAYWQDVMRSRIDALATRLELIAEQSAKRIDAAQVAQLTDPGQMGSPPHTALVAALREIQRDFGVDNAILLRRVADGSFRYIADGDAQFVIGQTVFIHDQFPETLRAALDAWERRGSMHTQLFGFGTFEYLQFNKPIEHEGQVVALLLLNQFAEDVDQAIRRDTIKLVIGTVGLFVFGALGFWAFSTRLLRPLSKLQAAADRLAAGELDVEILPVPGQDEVARLNASFRTMVAELQRSRAALEQNNAELKRTLARIQLMEDLEKSLFKFVPRSARAALHADPAALERGKTDKDVSVLFVDVEGSSVLTEAMEAQQVDRLIEGYFSQYLDCIYENQGDITETAGDGLMIIFQSDDPAQHALNAVRTALQIQAATQRLCAAAASTQACLRVNVGINSGPALVGFTRYEAISGGRVTFTASGRTTILAARLQDLATGGSVLASEETVRRISIHPQFAELGWRLEALGAVSLKNLHAAEHVYRIGAAAGQEAATAGAA